MKKSIYLMGTLLAAAITIAAVPEKENDPEKIKVTVVHYADGHATVMDTSFDAASDYTVEQFLLDHNLDPAKTEVIDTDDFDGKYSVEQGENSFLFMREGDFEKVQIDIRGMDEMWISDEMDQEIQVEVERMISEKMEGMEEMELEIEQIFSDELAEIEEFINSEEGEGFAQEIIVIRNGDDEKTYVSRKNLHHGEESEEVIIERADGEEVTVIEVDEIEMVRLKENMEKLLEEHEALLGELKHIQIDENALQQIEIEKQGGDDNDKEVRKVVVHRIGKLEAPPAPDAPKAPAAPEMITMSEYTIAIVSRTGGDAEESNSEEFITDPVELPIEGPSFFPNPTAGNFRLEFFLPERGQTQIQIFDMQGREVFTENLGNFQGAYNNEIDISELSQGAYILNITQNNLRLAEKIIVN